MFYDQSKRKTYVAKSLYCYHEGHIMCTSYSCDIQAILSFHFSMSNWTPPCQIQCYIDEIMFFIPSVSPKLYFGKSDIKLHVYSFLYKHANYKDRIEKKLSLRGVSFPIITLVISFQLYINIHSCNEILADKYFQIDIWSIIDNCIILNAFSIS